MYAIPVYRATVYILGILLGYALRVYKSHQLTVVSNFWFAKKIHFTILKGHNKDSFWHFQIFAFKKNTNHSSNLQKELRTGWYVSSLLFIAAFFGPAPMGSITYVYNEYHAAIYAALGPIAWCGLFAWIVFTSHLGYESMKSMEEIKKKHINILARIFVIQVFLVEYCHGADFW